MSRCVPDSRWEPCSWSSAPIGIAFKADAPTEYRGAAFRLALVAMLLAAVVVGGRDTVVRWASEEHEISSAVGAAAAGVSGSVTILLYVVVKGWGTSLGVRLRRSVTPFGLIGLAVGVNTLFIFEAFERGRVTVVSPLIGTAMLWTLVFSLVTLGKSEGLGKRVIASALLVAGGVALISVTRGSGG